MSEVQKPKSRLGRGLSSLISISAPVEAEVPPLDLSVGETPRPTTLKTSPAPTAPDSTWDCAGRAVVKTSVASAIAQKCFTAYPLKS